MKQFIHECELCQKNKIKSINLVRFLQPLLILQLVWIDVSMDFIKRLPMSRGYFVIMVAVDRLSKYAHFIASSNITLQHLKSLSYFCLMFSNSMGCL